MEKVKQVRKGEELWQRGDNVFDQVRIWQEGNQCIISHGRHQMYTTVPKTMLFRSKLRQMAYRKVI